MSVKHCLSWLLFIIFVIALDLVCSSRRRNFATKSAYPFYNSNDKIKTPESCTPLHINMVFRHGTRYPGTKDIKGMNKMASYVNQYFNQFPGKYANLTLPWTNRFHYGDKMLAKTGEEEMYNISKRLLKRFPSLFPRYIGERHYFISTSTPRSSQSASAFALGLFEGKGHLGPSKLQPVSIMTTNLTHPLLRFFDACERYKKEVSKNKEVALKEFHEFKNGPEMEHVKKVIADRLNISGITTNHVQHMFLSCAYEVAIYGNGSWCSIFDEEHLDIVEYLYDIKNYWKRGYGYKINYEISCCLLKNLTGSIHNAVKHLNSSHTLAIFHFSHAETLIPLLCMLALFNNTEQLQAHNYHKQKDRPFRTANMAPFSGNVAMVLYSCENIDKEQTDNSSFYVQVLVNENVVGLSCCDSKELCPLQQFLACFEDVHDWCDFSEMCRHDESNSEPHNEL